MQLAAKYPAGLRSIVNAIFLFTQSLASILVLFFVPIMHDPLLVCPFLVTVCGFTNSTALV